VEVEAPQEGQPIALVADSDAEHRAQLASLLDASGYTTVEAATGDDALALAKSAAPDLVILEIALDGTSGYEVCRVLREEFGDDLPIVFISGNRTESYDRVAGLLVGADDYLVKPYASDELLARVRRLASRAQAREAVTTSRLTPRELEVLQLMADGASPADIAARLFISPKTVRTHIDHILGKLDVNSRAQAVAIAYRDGLVDAAV
jgi:DNA-binding NarL/FixJ family response regulator